MNQLGLKYKAELLGNAETDRAKRIWRTAAIAEPLQYLSNFWWLFKMPLIYCKVELKLCNDDTSVDPNIIFTSRSSDKWINLAHFIWIP